MAVKSSPDWFARGTALVAILLSVIGLWLAYRNYSWQMKTYREGLEERILVHLGTSRTVKNSVRKRSAIFTSVPFIQAGL